MKCRICDVDKLSKECIPYSITAKCEHPKLICLRCATKAAKDTGICPYKNCGQPVSEDSQEIKEFNLILGFLFSEIYPLPDDLPLAVNEKSSAQSIYIVMLTGDRHVFPFQANDTVQNLKQDICQQLNIKVEKQKLLYEEKELKEYIGNRKALLKDFNIQANSSIFLLVVLCSIPSNLKHVTFDLSWNYPQTGKDYLDATCLIYSGTDCVRAVDYRYTFLAPDWAVTWLHSRINARGDTVTRAHVEPNQMSVRHTGDNMSDYMRTGRHTIDVYLDRLPSNITSLFFVLSAWKHPTISHFPNPTLKFYEKNHPGVNLCETTFTHARHSSAVIMCSLSRCEDQWRVIESGALSSGNAKDYGPLKAKIRQMIREGKC